MTVLKNHEKISYYVVILLGFLQEAGNGISLVAIQFLYKDEFHLEPSDASFIDSLSTIPWIVKPLWGYITDNFYFCGYRRKSYLILFALFQILAWCLLLSFTSKIYVGVVCLVCGSAAGAFINVICEALLVEITQSKSEEKSEEEQQTEASNNVANYYGARYFGTFMTVFSGGVLLENISMKIIFSISAFFSLSSGFSSLFLQELTKTQKEKIQKLEEENENEDSVKFLGNQMNLSQHEQTPNENIQIAETETEDREDLEAKRTEDQEIETQDKEKNSVSQPIEDKSNSFTKLKNFFFQKAILLPVSCIFLLTMRPSSNQAIFFFYTNKLQFAPEFIGILQLIHSLGSIFGVFFYNRFCKFIGFRKFFIVTTLIYASLDLSQILLVKRINQQWGIPDHFFCILDSLITDFMLELNIFPVLILSCRLSPKNIEGTMYALLMSIYNFSLMLGSQFGGLGMRLLDITENNFDNLPMLIVIANLWVVSVLPFIYFANFENATKSTKECDPDVLKKRNEEKI